MKQISGLPASSGSVVGPAWTYRPVKIVVEQILNCDSGEETLRLHNAIEVAREQLKALHAKALRDVGAEEAEIFAAHQMFLDDPEYVGLMNSEICDNKTNAESGVQTSTETYASLLEGMDNEYFKARAQDVRDVGRRILYALKGIDPASFEFPTQPVVILAEDLTPSDTMQFKKESILGFCTIKGGPTSHTAILARSLGVPACVNVDFCLDDIKDGQQVILDGTKGLLVLDPADEDLKAAEAAKEKQDALMATQLKKANDPAVTKDGHQVEVVANIGSADDAKQAVEYGAEGVGLLRTEFLYLGRSSMPNEADQVKAYQAIAKEMDGRPIVVRTLDIGGDKEVSYLGLKNEPNPFLGWRAIRMMSERPEVLETQFRALLLGFAGADLRIMLPLVASVDEIRKAKEIYANVRAALVAEGAAIAEDVQFGIMVEVPSAAVMAGFYADEVDFFSIGTNDLTQYTLAVDRTNERVAELASYFHPAVVQLIAMTISKAHEKGKWVGLCGEMAGDPMATKLLLGLGLDEFSMAPISVPQIKELIRGCDLNDCKAIADKALSVSSTDEVIKLL